MCEFRFGRSLTAGEALTLERSLVAHGSRLVYSAAAEVTGAICRRQDLNRWMHSGIDRTLSAQRVPDRSELKPLKRGGKMRIKEMTGTVFKRPGPAGKLRGTLIES